MKSNYKDRELPEALKEKMMKKTDKEYRMGAEKCSKCKGDKKKCPGGKACPMTAKKDMARKGPYADGMCGKRGDIASEFNSVMIGDAEREDKPCGNSYIPQNAKCNKGAGQAASKKPSARQQAAKIFSDPKEANKFLKQKASTQGAGRKIMRAGEFAGRIGGATLSALGGAQLASGIATGNLGAASRGYRNVALGGSVGSLAAASKARRMGNKALSNEFLKGAGKSAATGLGQEAVLGGIAGFNRAGGKRGVSRRLRELSQTARRRAQGVRTNRR